MTRDLTQGRLEYVGYVMLGVTTLEAVRKVKEGKPEGKYSDYIKDAISYIDDIKREKDSVDTGWSHKRSIEFTSTENYSSAIEVIKLIKGHFKREKINKFDQIIIILKSSLEDFLNGKCESEKRNLLETYFDTLSKVYSIKLGKPLDRNYQFWS